MFLKPVEARKAAAQPCRIHPWYLRWSSLCAALGAALACLLPLPAIAGFALIARTGDPLPGGVAGETFSSLPEAPVIHEGMVVFTGIGSAQTRGVYRSLPGQSLERIVDTRTAPPSGAPGPFLSFSNVATRSGWVVFQAYHDQGVSGIYTWNATEGLHWITSSSNYLGPPIVGDPHLPEQPVCFPAWNGVFCAPAKGGPLKAIVDTNDRWPFSDRHLAVWSFNQVVAHTRANGDDYGQPLDFVSTIFYARDDLQLSQANGGILRQVRAEPPYGHNYSKLVVGNGDPIPGGGGSEFAPTEFSSFDSDDGRTVVFVGRSGPSYQYTGGIYRADFRYGGFDYDEFPEISRIADDTTPVPPGAALFKRFGQVSFDNVRDDSVLGPSVVFTGAADVGWAGFGLYGWYDKSAFTLPLAALVSPGDTLDGRTVTSVAFTRGGLSHAVPAFLAQLGGGYAIYVAEPDCDTACTDGKCSAETISCEECRRIFPRTNAATAARSAARSTAVASASVTNSSLALAGGGPFVQTFRDARDRLLAATPKGQHYIQLYNAHTAEVRDLIATNPALISKGIAFLRTLEPAFQGLLGGAGSRAEISAEQVQAVDDFLGAVAEKASPALRDAIQQQRTQWGPLDAYVGKTMTEARQQVLGYGVFLPRVSNP